MDQTNSSPHIIKRVKDDFDLAPNYRITIASEETVARMYLETQKKKTSPQNIKTIIEIMREKSGVLHDQIARIISSYQGHLLSHCRIIEAHNKIPNVLRYELAKKIAGITVTPTFVANYLAVGSGIAAVSDTDTQLGTELVRGLFTQRTADLNTAYLDKFFTATEVGGLTINEIGTFVDGTPTANSGFLLSRILTNITLSSNETLSVNVSITLNSAT